MPKPAKVRTIDVPMVPAPPPGASDAVRNEYLPGHMGPHLELQMNGPQSELLHRIFEALRQHGVRIKSPARVVDTRADVLRWWFEELERADEQAIAAAAKKVGKKART